MKSKGLEKKKKDFVSLNYVHVKRFAGLCDKSDILESILGSKKYNLYWGPLDLIIFRMNFPVET